jgi:alkylated DNA repair dioxygenase AlkB
MACEGMQRAPATDVQQALFQPDAWLPEGFRYQEGFLTVDEEQTLLAIIRTLPFQQAQYKEFTARRRVVSYGGRYDFSANELLPADAMPAWLHGLRDRAAGWAGLSPAGVDHALVAEYAPGTPLGWHRDVPDFEAIVGVSLGGSCRMRFRRYPPSKPARAELHLDLAPRSIYTMQREARWNWQHSVSPTKELRYSITFRTRRGNGAAGAVSRRIRRPARDRSAR